MKEVRPWRQEVKGRGAPGPRGSVRPLASAFPVERCTAALRRGWALRRRLRDVRIVFVSHLFVSYLFATNAFVTVES
ncbi:hypothetical protein Sgou_35240 [Streptomyces gougerotii]|uniref:Uncharacterized protein n=2 Tax=Streptomyces diastaticus group TaxID=2849069 RepID=A0A8H9LR82_9ACTN|nr:hypothetical protein Sdia_47380 [Streptomyces diastaticus subsp. diastaticus]GFH78854.1 hypothetical protein Sgou_35240 [Streptomyces gougerotii]GGU28524.1 hypothetical protein GCM10015534_33890 [Streptomyces diastaticus subsp. diastaticus]GGU68602.1 hypothetical protein GCM10010227_23050 [Streptomyces gougerotii]